LHSAKKFQVYSQWMVVGLHGNLGLAWVAWVVSLMIGLFSLPAVSDWTHAVLGPRQHQVDAQKIGKWVTGGGGGQADTALEGTAGRRAA